MFASLRRLLLAVSLIALAAAVLVFVLQNRQLTHLVVIGLPTPELPVAVLMSIAFMLGALFALSMSLWLVARLRMRVVRLQRELLLLQRAHQKNSN